MKAFGNRFIHLIHLTILICGISAPEVLPRGEVRYIQILANQRSVPLGVTPGPDEVLQVSHGTISQANDGELLYTPAPGFTGRATLHINSGSTTVPVLEINVQPYPNFVFILTDDQSWTGLSTRMDMTNPDSASDFHLTPNIDRLATEGMRFSRGYSPAPNCSPSRYANLTGKTCARLKFTDILGRGHTTKSMGQKLIPIDKETHEIRSEDWTIPELLKSLPMAGYRTAHWGKWHLGGGGPKHHGFDESDGNTGNAEGSQGKVVHDDPKRAYSITRRANGFLEKAAAASAPFYCQVSHYAVHAKIQYRTDTLEALKDRKPGENHSDSAYAAMVADLDASVGELLDRIDDLGLRHSTYVIYQADNGAPQFLSNAYPLKRYKPEIWEGGTRVPTFLRGPGIEAGSQCDHAMMGIDILPTVWELAGGKPEVLPTDLDGASLVPWLHGDHNHEIRRRGELVIHSPHYILTKDGSKNQRPSTAFHDGPWKLVAWYETGDIHLFNLQDDISETRDVGADYPQEKLRLWRRLRDYLEEVDAQLPRIDPAHPDGDRLEDQWEFSRMLTHSMTGVDDPDQDGADNLSEFLAGSDPLDPSSKPHVPQQ